MPSLRVRVPTEDLRPGLERIRLDLRVPEAFPAEVEAEAAEAVARGPGPEDRADRRDLPLLTIDPPGSLDLDQAFFARRLGTGFRVQYAIADVAAFVRPDGAIDREAWVRGQTLYMPDVRAPLHPAAISESAASLLPEVDRPALLWTIDLDEAGEVEASILERAVVRSRRAMSYAEAQADLDGGAAAAGGEDPLVLLRETGRLREELERRRGGVSLNLPTQQVTPAAGGYRFSFEAMLPVEGWNAQISLLAGHCAAAIMAEGGVGILRTLPPIGEGILAKLRRAADALEIDWPRGASLGDVVRMQDGGTPESAAFLVQATHALRGAGYAVIEGTPPPVHGALEMVYAHVTAPLRRLVDRYANEITVALCADAAPPDWAVGALARLPETMAESDRRSDAVEAAVLNLAEAVVLAPQVGRTFDATVIDRGPDRATVQLRDPPVVAKVGAGGVRLGERVRVRLTGADPVERRLDLEVV